MAIGIRGIFWIAAAASAAGALMALAIPGGRAREHAVARPLPVTESDASIRSAPP